MLLGAVPWVLLRHSPAALWEALTGANPTFSAPPALGGGSWLLWLLLSQEMWICVVQALGYVGRCLSDQGPC